MLLYIHKTTKTKKRQTIKMEITQSIIEPVTMTEVLGLATWDKPRTSEDLRDFISRRSSIAGI